MQTQLPPPANVLVAHVHDLRTLVVTWDEVRGANLGEVRYNVYRSLAQQGAFVKLNDQPLLVNRYEDADISINPNVDNWYAVTAVYEPVPGLQVEGAMSRAAHYRVHNTDKWFYKINERNMWILRNTGQLFDLYTRRYTGERCPLCVDNVRLRAGTYSCPVCYGTGFVGGYEPAYQLYVRLKPVETSLGVSSQMLVNDNSPGAWTITDTIIANRDLLISPQGTIYQVLAVHVNQAAGFLFHTELRMRALDPTDQLYSMKRATLYPKAWMLEGSDALP